MDLWYALPRHHSARPRPQLTGCFALQEHRPRISAHRLGSVRSVMEDIKLADNLSWNDFQQAPPMRGRTQTEMSRLWEEYREGGRDGAKLSLGLR